MSYARLPTDSRFPDNVPEGLVEELPIEDPTVPLGQGYSESKWVAEMILHAAAKISPLRPIVVRIGQISGGKNGAWNTSEWFGATIKSSLALGCLPELKGVSLVFILSW